MFVSASIVHRAWHRHTRPMATASRDCSPPPAIAGDPPAEAGDSPPPKPPRPVAADRDRPWTGPRSVRPTAQRAAHRFALPLLTACSTEVWSRRKMRPSAGSERSSRSS
ncbi:hypothetical protein C6558_09305 [Ensifer sp. NM-2]|nr:hypothetical protein [Ensifer canadensis]PSS65557.1 hypothetical protein C6558_09305 [Ensifer sp. NM-2]